MKYIFPKNKDFECASLLAFAKRVNSKHFFLYLQRKMEGKFQVLDYIILVIILVLSVIVGLFHEVKENIENSNFFKRIKSKNRVKILSS